MDGEVCEVVRETDQSEGTSDWREIFDILGNSINVNTEQSRENLRKIDLRGLVVHNGFYTYRVSLDGIILSYGKFIKE